MRNGRASSWRELVRSFQSYSQLETSHQGHTTYSGQVVESYWKRVTVNEYTYHGALKENGTVLSIVPGRSLYVIASVEHTFWDGFEDLTFYARVVCVRSRAINTLTRGTLGSNWTRS